MDFIYMGGGYGLDIFGRRSGPEILSEGRDNGNLNSIKLTRISRIFALLLDIQKGVFMWLIYLICNNALILHFWYCNQTKLAFVSNHFPLQINGTQISQGGHILNSFLFCGQPDRGVDLKMLPSEVYANGNRVSAESARGREGAVV